jgi:cell division inhibitor SepF
MGALRKAGVWLGLVEEEDDRRYDGGYDDDFAEDEDFTPVRPRAFRQAERPPAPERTSQVDRIRPVERLASTERELAQERERDRELVERGGLDRGADLGRSDRASVRPITRPTSNASSNTTSYPTQDNLALAPQVQLRERAVVSEPETTRYQITTVHPTTYSEARTIGEHFRDGVPVIMNLTEMEEADAKRLVDFAAGLAFGLRGSMERVTNRVFLLSPANVQVTAEDKAKIAQGGFFDQS